MGSATLKCGALCWSPGRGVYAQVECAQLADQERVVSKVMSEMYLNRKLSCSSVVGGEYSGMAKAGYRVDWNVVASEAAIAGIEAKAAKKLEKLMKEHTKAGKSAKAK